MIRYILIGVAVACTALLVAIVTMLVLERQAMPDFSLVGKDLTANAISEVPSGMETPQREFAVISEIELAEEEQVIALEVDGQAYAFPKLFMAGEGNHIASEILGELPVVVCYCDETECVRVFADSSAERRIALEQQGLLDGGLAVTYAGKVYKQDSKEIPLPEHEYTLVTWGEWKAANAQGLVLTEQIWEEDRDSQEQR